MDSSSRKLLNKFAQRIYIDEDSSDEARLLAATLMLLIDVLEKNHLKKNHD